MDRTTASIGIVAAALVKIVAAGALVSVTGTRVAAQDIDKGAVLMAEARRAIGGEERLDAVKTLDVRGDVKRAMGPMNTEGELRIRMEIPGKLRRDEDLSLPGGGPAIVRTEVLNGATVWEESSGGANFVGRFGRGEFGRGGGPGGRRRAGRGPMLDPTQVEDLQRRTRQAELARLMLAWLLATDAPVAWVGTAESPDGKADVLEISPSTGTPMRLFLDQTSHMPLMITWRGVAPRTIAFRRGAAGTAVDQPREMPASAEQATLRMTLGDYKTIDGVKLPHFITRGVDSTTIEEWTVDSYRINASFKPDVFTK
jgi:hypothetical protein